MKENFDSVEIEIVRIEDTDVVCHSENHGPFVGN